MQTDKVLRTILAREGVSAEKVSTILGKGPRYLDMYRYRRRTPKADTLATILQACGYELIARSLTDGYELPIDPIDTGE